MTVPGWTVPSLPSQEEGTPDSGGGQREATWQPLWPQTVQDEALVGGPPSAWVSGRGCLSNSRSVPGPSRPLKGARTETRLPQLQHQSGSPRALCTDIRGLPARHQRVLEEQGRHSSRLSSRLTPSPRVARPSRVLPAPGLPCAPRGPAAPEGGPRPSCPPTASPGLPLLPGLCSLPTGRFAVKDGQPSREFLSFPASEVYTEEWGGRSAHLHMGRLPRHNRTCVPHAGSWPHPPSQSQEPWHCPPDLSQALQVGVF